ALADAQREPAGIYHDQAVTLPLQIGTDRVASDAAFFSFEILFRQNPSGLSSCQISFFVRESKCAIVAAERGRGLWDEDNFDCFGRLRAGLSCAGPSRASSNGDGAVLIL
ncbi:MAG TPA: hypothetical protein VMF67_09535, partial [Rhizomicrobium sp.]|nr:hypothetical protein [Rhizomicrobium sp.]